MTIQLFVDINDDWSRTVKSRKAQKALPRWQRWEPALRSHRSFDDLLVVSASRNREQADDVLRALLRVGHEDSLAWRTVLQAVLPGVVKIARSFIPGPHSDEEVAAAVVAIAWGRIAEYPLERRPNAIGANIVLDTRQQATRSVFRERPAEFPTDRIGHILPPVLDTEDPARAVLRILRRAVHDNVVSLEDARLVALTRIADVPVERLAVERGILPHSLRRRRLRVEGALAGLTL